MFEHVLGNQLFIIVIVICKTVANETQIKYGIWIYVIHFAYGNIAIIAHIIVAKTRTISMDAYKLFFKPNCKGVNARLKNKFRMKGSKITNAIFF
jgi:hypothetical protein